MNGINEADQFKEIINKHCKDCQNLVVICNKLFSCKKASECPVFLKWIEGKTRFRVQLQFKVDSEKGKVYIFQGLGLNSKRIYPKE